MNYTYDYEDDKFTVKLDTGGSVEICMVAQLFCFYGCNTDIELEFDSDDLKDLIFLSGEKHYTALAIIQECERVHDDVRRETEQELVDEEGHYREVSSPYYSGRV